MRALRKGFTLLELLVVLGVIAILTSLIGPAVIGLLNSSRIAESMTLLGEELATARGKATLENREVEVRFYSYADEEGGEAAFRAFQIIGYNVVTDPTADGYRAPVPGEEFRPNEEEITGILTFPTGVVLIDEPADLSTILTHASRKPASGNAPPVAVVPPEPDAEIRRFRFLPDGTTDLDIDREWHVTLVEEIRMEEGQLPKDFATLQIDPHNGRTRWLRPN